MNDQFGGQNLQTNNPVNPSAPVSMTPPVPSEPSGWAPAAVPIPAPAPTPIPISTPPPPPPISSNPFETTPPPVPPVSGPMQPSSDQGMMEPAGPKSSLPLIIVLAILIVLGGLFFASWMGWITLFGLEKLWTGSKPTTPVVEQTEPPVSNVNVNDAKRKEDLANLKTALKAYYTAKQSYPVAATTEKTLDSVALKVLVPDYIAALPVDPSSPTYYYGYKSDGTTFELTCILEDTNDPAGITSGTNFLYHVTSETTETPSTSSGSSASTPATQSSSSTPATSPDPSITDTSAMGTATGSSAADATADTSL